MVWHYPFLTFHWCYSILGSVALGQSGEFKTISDVSAKGKLISCCGGKHTAKHAAICIEVPRNKWKECTIIHL